MNIQKQQQTRPIEILGLQMLELGKLTPRRWNRAVEVIVSQVQVLQIWHAAKRIGQRARQIVLLQIPT